MGADPTNRRLAGETHVKIGHGRFYADVPPVKGLYLGGANSELMAAVRCRASTRRRGRGRSAAAVGV